MVEPTRRQLTLRTLDAFVREQLQSFSHELEQKLKIEGLSNAMHFVLMELVGNAVKANLKRVYFGRNGYSLNDTQSYQQGIEAFMRDYNSIDEVEYTKALHDLNLKVEVEVDINRERALIHVHNNTVILAEEERRVRRQLAGSMNIKNIVDFSMHYGDETEGRGLGLAMIVLLIRDLGFNPDYFRVYCQGARTTARLEFPLSADYRPIRERMAQVSGA